MRVFFTSPWIPAEWIRAHGLEPRGIWFAKEFQRGAPPLSAGVCAFAERVVRFAESEPDCAVIFTTTCDQLRRGFDVATFRGDCRAFLFNIPATQTSAAKLIYRYELERLGQFLLDLGGRVPTPEILRREMLQAGEARRRLLESATDSSARCFAEAVARFHRQGVAGGISGRRAAPPSGTDQKRVRLAIVGGPLCAPHWPLLGAIDAAGGRIVLNATETGERGLCPACEPEGADVNPFDALAGGWFENIIDVFQRPNARLYSWLKPRLLSRKARGIVLWHFTGCDLWRAEAQTLREAFGLPVLMLEAGEGPGASARDVNRIQAFVETLK